MNITCFDDLLQIARQQPEPQRLLLVFVSAVLPEGSSPEEAARFEQGMGGALVPLARVDKGLDELASFEQLMLEATAMLPPDPPWVMVMVAGMSGENGQAPTAQDAQAPLAHMVESIKAGQIAHLLPFDRSGVPVRLG